MEVGTLEVVGKYEDDNISLGLNRTEKQMKGLENQSNQTNVSLNKMNKIGGALVGSFLAFGGIAVGTMTNLATKSPVLAGTMAKIDVQMMKLSNTVGRQLKPVFETIANDLMPNINKAFKNNGTFIDNFVDRIDDSIKALSDLINLDWVGLISNINNVFEPESFKNNPARKTELENKYGSFAESYERFDSMFLTPSEIREKGLKQSLKEIPSMTFNLATGGGMQLTAQLLLDSLEWLFNGFGKKNSEIAKSTGMSRGG